MDAARIVQPMGEGDAVIKPDFIIKNARGEYLRRWFITRWTDDNHPLKGKRLPNSMLHHILDSDDDRALHDHPWDNMSIVVWGGYVEHVFARPPVEGMELPPVIQKRRRAGSIVFRRAELAHRLVLNKRWNHMNSDALVPCWTIFITWRKRREWGFWCEKHGTVGETVHHRPAFIAAGTEHDKADVVLRYTGMVGLWIHWKCFSTWIHERRPT